MFNVLGPVAFRHDVWLVLLTVLMCFLASLLASSLFSLAVRATREARLVWLFSAAVVGGSGFWATHFLAVLSYRPGLAVGYDPAVVLAALGLSVVSTAGALVLLVLSRDARLRMLACALFGVTQVLIHSASLAAFRTTGILSVDGRYVAVAAAASLGVVLVASTSIRRLSRWRDRAWASAAITLTICTLHLVSMAGARVTPDARILLGPHLIAPVYLAASVACTLLLAVSVATLAMVIHSRTSAGALRRMRDVIEAMPSSFAYYDAEDRAVIWNERYRQRALLGGSVLKVGTPYAEVMGASVAVGLYPEAVGRETAWLAEHFGVRASLADSHIQELRKGGGWVQLQQRRTGEGGIISVITDITDLKLVSERLAEALARAEAADRVKTEFLSNLSHELRTPLNGVVGLTDVLASTELTAPQRQVVEAIFASAQSLTDLIASMLDFSDLQSGGTGLKADPLDPAEMVQEAARLFAPAALAKGLQLHVDVRSRPGLRVVGDRARLRQVLISLLSNAVKFTEAGVVSISLDAEEGDAARRLRFAVADTGIGFDGAQADRLFAQFAQGDGSMTRRFGGAGLGLAMSRQIAELMGAELTANSLPGHGATFTFAVTLQAAADTAPAPSLEQDFDPQPLGEVDEAPLRVLLADDHPTNRQVVELILGATDAATTSVENGAEALEAFQHGRYDLVLMDLQMPVMDGLTAMKAIRDYESSAHLPRTPMIALTANVLAEHVAASMAAGADRHMGKPITAARLLDEIGKVFERHTAANDLPNAA